MAYTEYDAILTKIIQVRKKHHKTQQDLADHLGITKQSYYRYESGLRKMSLDRIAQIANFFGLPENFFLLNHVSVSSPKDEHIKSLLEYFITLKHKSKFKEAAVKTADTKEEKKKHMQELIYLREEMLDAKFDIEAWLDRHTLNLKK